MQNEMAITYGVWYGTGNGMVVYLSNIIEYYYVPTIQPENLVPYILPILVLYYNIGTDSNCR